MQTNRLSAIDGLRGIAILLVALFHIFVSNVEFVPWLPNYAANPFFQNSFLGVELFFLISGFVIYMTLERSQNYKSFLIKRWLRLFPAMAIVSIAIYILANYFAERVTGTPGILDLLPGMLFIEPVVLSAILGTEVDNVDGVLWSIHVEIKYYILFGALYFLNREKALLRFIALYFVAFAFKVFARFMGNETIWMIEEFVNLTSIHLFGWFCTGMLIYKWYQHKNKEALLFSPVLLAAATLTSGELKLVPTLLCISFYVVFLGALINEPIRKILSNRILLFVGFISYPLYLIHDSLMIMTVTELHKVFPEITSYAIYIPGISFAVLLSYLLAKYCEPFFRTKGNDYLLRSSSEIKQEKVA